MRLWIVGVVAAALVGPSALGGRAEAIAPGDRIAGMRFVRGTEATSDQKLFDICDPVVQRPGLYRRACGRVPAVRRLFIGYGIFASPTRIARAWAQTKWTAWFDGRPIRLAAFGTSDRTLYRFPPAGYDDVTLREWRIVLVRAAPGSHSIRYRMRDSRGVVDITWRFTSARF